MKKGFERGQMFAMERAHKQAAEQMSKCESPRRQLLQPQPGTVSAFFDTGNILNVFAGMQETILFLNRKFCHNLACEFYLLPATELKISQDGQRGQEETRAEWPL